MMGNGSSGYLLKNAGMEELLKATGMDLQRKKQMSHEAALAFRSHPDREAPMLTSREKEVTELIASGHTNQETADKLFVSYSTLDGCSRRFKKG